MLGIVAVIECAGDFALGFFFRFADFDAVFPVGCHGLFGDDVESFLKSFEDVGDVIAIPADDENCIGFGLLDHLVEFFRHIGGNVCRFGDLLFADVEPDRVDVKHSDEFRGIREFTVHRLDPHSDCAAGHSADGVTALCHNDSSLVGL